MKLLKRIFIVLLNLLIMNLYLTNITFAQQARLYAEAQITKHPPQILAPQEEKIPIKKVAKKKSKWLWLILGIALVGGGAAAISGGGDEGSGSNGPDTGSVSGSW